MEKKFQINFYKLVGKFLKIIVYEYHFIISKGEIYRLKNLGPEFKFTPCIYIQKYYAI